MKSRLAALCLALAIPLVGCDTTPPAPSAPPIASDLAYATFDSVWSIIDRTHFDPEFGGVDWDGVRARLRPQVAAVETQDELRAILQEMIDELGLSHFGILTGAALDVFGDDVAGGGSANVGITLRLVDGQPVVWRVREGSSAAEHGVQSGWIVEAIDGRNLAERIERARAAVDPEKLPVLLAQAAPQWLSGPATSSVDIDFIDGGDTPRALTLTRETPPGVINRFGNLPAVRVSTVDSLAHVEGHDVGVIGFNIWLMPVAVPFDAAVDAYRQADGIVIDLRGNPGGIGAMSMGLAGHFLTERESLGTMSTRNATLEFRANPRLSNAAGERVEPFAGPVAILVDGLSMSTSEIFAQGMKAIGRARIFGEPTPGAALPSFITELPNGDGLQHAVADFVDPEGQRLEANGVVPDEIVPLDRAALLAGRDNAFDAALAWIAAAPSSPRR